MKVIPNLDKCCNVSFLPVVRYFLIGILALAFAHGAGAGSITLQWDPVVDDPLVTGYEVHYGPAGEQYQWVTNADTNGAATDTKLVESENLVAGEIYCFAVKSHNQDGSLVSAFSNEVCPTIASLSDTTPPAVSISTTPEGPTYTSAQTVTVSASASDNVGVNRVEFYDGTILKGVDTIAPYSYAWTISSADNGSYSWTAKAYDAVGNVTTSGALSRTVDISYDSISEFVAAYSFEEAEGTVILDASGNGNDGLIVGATRTTTGRYGSAVSFDGVDDWIDLNTLDIAGGDGLTISVWMKADDFGTYDARLISKATGVDENDHYWMLSTFENNSVRFRLKAGGTTTTLISNGWVITAGLWHHVTATYDGLRMRLYVDGAEVGSIAKTGVIDTNASVPAAIGNQPQGAKSFDGLIDEVRLYNRGLSTEQIQEDMTKQIVVLPSDTLIADFKVSAQSGTAPFTATFYDSSLGEVTEWSWDFGNGGTSTAQNPQHTYGEPGTYTVSLTASGPDGRDSEIKLGYITVSTSSDGSTRYPQLEVGEADIDYQWQWVAFETTFDEPPIVVAKLVSAYDETPATIRIRNIGSTGFEIRVQEWEYLNDTHGCETVSYLAMESGSWELDDGQRIEANRLETDATAFWESRVFAQPFGVAPVVLAAVTTENGTDAITTRLGEIGVDQFQVRMYEQEANLEFHFVETISYIAWEPSSGMLDGVPFEVGATRDEVRHEPYAISFQSAFASPPVFLADMQTTDGEDTSNVRCRDNSASGVEVWVQEEQSEDVEMRHTTEEVGYMSFGQ